MSGETATTNGFFYLMIVVYITITLLCFRVVGSFAPSTVWHKSVCDTGEKNQLYTGFKYFLEKSALYLPTAITITIKTSEAMIRMSTSKAMMNISA